MGAPAFSKAPEISKLPGAQGKELMAVTAVYGMNPAVSKAPGERNEKDSNWAKTDVGRRLGQPRQEQAAARSVDSL